MSGLLTSNCPKCGEPRSISRLGGMCARCVTKITLAGNGGDLADGKAEESRDQLSASGMVVAGDYTLLEPLGRGGAGIVFRARQRSLNRTVALKMLLAGQFADAEELRRFRAEAEAAARLDHPNIVPIHEVGEEEGRPFFSMKLVEGGTLAARLATMPNGMPPREAARIIARVARAVHYAHQRGFIHRDLKPANILLDGGDEPLVTDFGLAKQIGIEAAGMPTLTGTVLGTPGYMAPEQAAGDAQEVTTAVDVFALGAVFYHLLTGHVPFKGTTAADTVRLSRDQPPPRLILAGGRTERDLETICLRCLEKESADRYGSAAAMAEDVERWLRHEPIHARAVIWTERLRKWVRRRPAIAAMTLLAALLLAGGVSGIAWQWRRATENARAAEQLATRESTARATAEARELTARSARYAADMKLCQEALSGHNLARARGLLDAHRPEREESDLRGWEWRWLWQQCRSDQPLLTCQANNGVRAAALSPDGQRAVILTDGDKFRVQLWNMETGGLITTVLEEARPASVAWTPDGRLFVCPASKSVELRRGDDGALVEKLALPLSPRALAVSPDGLWLAAMDGDGGVRVWELASRRVVCDFTQAVVTAHFGGAICFLPGTPARLACGAGGGSVSIVRLESGSKESGIAAHPALTCISALAVSPDGTLLATGSAYDDFTIRIWNIASGDKVAEIKEHTSWIAGLSFMPDGHHLLTCGADHTVRIIDTASWSAVRVLRGHLHEVWGMSLTPDGQRLLTGDKTGTLLLRKPDTTPPAGSVFAFPEEVINAVSAGRQVLTINSAADRSLSYYDPLTWQEMRVPGACEGQTFIHESGVVVRWTGATAAEIFADPPDLEHPTAKVTCPPVQLGAERATDSRLICTGEDGSIVQGDFRRGNTLEALPQPPGAGKLHSPFFLEAAGQIAASDEQGRFWRWHIEARRWQGPWVPPVHSPLWEMSQDAHWLGAGHGNEVVLAPLDGGPVIRRRQKAAIEHLTFSPDGRWFAACDELAIVLLWDLHQPNAPPRELRGHLNAVHRLCFTPDSTRLVTLCSHAEAARFWAAESGEELLTLAGPPEIRSAKFACNGDVLLVQGQGRWHAWRAPTVAEIEAAEQAHRW